MLQIRCRIWLERDGKPVFGDGRAGLLSAIERTGSLSAAAKDLGMPYRTAWQHLNVIEEAYGTPIVARQTGGAHGGGCQLTAAGREVLHAYLKLRDGVDKLLTDRFHEIMPAT